MFTGLVDENALEDLTRRDPYKVALAPGVVNWMRPGDKIEFPVQAGPEDQFEAYVTALCKFVGASMRIPFEVLLMTFNASYSASRASLLQFWGRVKVMRQGLIDQFVQPVYTAWLMEAIARGVIKAPGFFDDPSIFRAWTRCSWSGPGPGSIDPVKEVQAAEKRLEVRTLNSRARVSRVERIRLAPEYASASARARPRRRARSALTSVQRKRLLSEVPSAEAAAIQAETGRRTGGRGQ